MFSEKLVHVLTWYACPHISLQHQFDWIVQYGYGVLGIIYLCELDLVLLGLTGFRSLYRQSTLLLSENAILNLQKYRYVHVIYLVVCPPYPINQILSLTKEGINNDAQIPEKIWNKQKHMVSHQKRHFPSKESPNKLPNKEIICIVWNLTENCWFCY